MLLVDAIFSCFEGLIHDGDETPLGGLAMWSFLFTTFGV